MVLQYNPYARPGQQQGNPYNQNPFGQQQTAPKSLSIPTWLIWLIGIGFLSFTGWLVWYLYFS